MSQARQHALGEATIGELAQTLRGSVVLPADPGYDQARAIYNAAHDRRPALIVRCAGVADVLRGVEFASSQGLELAVRGGGHSIPGFSATDGGMVLDLSPMTGIRVDPAAQRALAGPGCVWRDLDHETQQFGLALTGGIISTTGIAGFTLGGGIGMLVRRCGLACDSLVGADVVTADGQFLHAGAGEHPDLLWALRGGGGNFGVVTSFEYALHDVGPTVFAGAVFYPGDAGAEMLRGYREACRGCPEELSTLAVLVAAPPVPFLPEDVHGTPVVGVIGLWSGAPERGEAATQPFRRLGPVIADVFSPMPYVAMQQMVDPLNPWGQWNHWRSAFVPGLGEPEIGALTALHAQLPTPLCELHVHHLGGAMGRVAPDATAFGTRDREFIVNVLGRTPGTEGFGQVVDWVRGATGAVAPQAPAYSNYTGEQTPELARASYPPTTYQRLAEIKARYDPANLFHLNQNIQPAAHAATPVH